MHLYMKYNRHLVSSRDFMGQRFPGSIFDVDYESQFQFSISIFNSLNTVAPSVDQQLLFRGPWQRSKN